MVRIQNGQGMVDERQHRIGTSENAQVPAMNAVEESNSQIHARNLFFGMRRAARSVGWRSIIFTNGTASSTENVPHRVRRQSSTHAPQPSAAPRSRASARTETPFVAEKESATFGGANSVTS